MPQWSLLDPNDPPPTDLDLLGLSGPTRGPGTEPIPSIWSTSNPVGTERYVDYTGWDTAGPGPRAARAAPTPIQQAIAPDPNAEYGEILPYAKDKDTGAIRLALPSSARSFLSGVHDLAQGPATGTVTPDATMALLQLAVPDLLKKPGGDIDLLSFGGSKRAAREAATTAKVKATGLLDDVIAKTETPSGSGLLDMPMVGQILADGEADRISTRIPWAKNLDVDPHTRADLKVGIDSSRASGDAYTKNSQFINGYGDIPTQSIEGDPEALHAALIAHAKDNLLYLHDSIPPEIRERSKLWYDGANTIAQRFADDYGISTRQAAGVLASLSPQKDWFQNVDLAKRILDIRRGQGNMTATPEMQPQFDRIINGQKDPEDALALRAHVEDFRTKPLSQISDPEAQALWIRAYDEAHNPRSYKVVTPEGDFGDPVLNPNGSERKVAWGSLGDIAKGVSAAQDDSLLSMSQLMGANHKVRNFYNNIVSPNATHGDVTIDTHAIAAAHMRPLAGGDQEVKVGLGLSPGSKNAATGSKGLYGAYAEAYRQAADQLGILPRELQSISWEGVRGLYSDVQKRNDTFTSGINDIWNRYGRGEISAQDARDASVGAAGGINPPEWWRPNPQGDAAPRR